MPNKVYRLSKHEGVDNLVLVEEDIPKPKRGQVLVRIHATSLNYRDIMVATGNYPPPYPNQVIPLSDGAGEVVEVGEDVTEFKVQDKVVGTFFEQWIDGPMRTEYLAKSLGGSSHGTLAQYRIFEKESMVKMPSHLSYEEAATLPCAAVTAWNALAHNNLQNIGPDQTVLVLGTGGVAIFAIQFAAAAGARVIVASSSDEKLAKAKQVGATDLINYTKDPEWNIKVRELTNGRGVDHVIEIGGAGTLERSIKSTRPNGQIHIIGFLAGAANFDVAMSILFSSVIVRGVYVGSRGMFETMNRALENHKIRPVIDRVFSFSEAKEAYKYLQSQKHVGKIVIKVD